MGRKLILHADDEPQIRDLVEIYVSKSFPDYEIKNFENGASLKKILEEISSGENKNVRVVILDNNMPEYSGEELIKEYAKKNEFNKIKFILFYGGDELTGEKAVQNGAFGYSIKPNLKGLVSSIEKALIL